MSGAAWKLRRLRAMGATEIGRRARVALRDRLAAPAYYRWPPETAFASLFTGDVAEVVASSRLRSLVRLPEDAVAASAFAPTLAAAEALRGGRWSLFGHEVALDDPPRWRCNYVAGLEWPDLPSARLDYRRADVAGGAKYVWELGRLTMLPCLVLASRLTGNPGYAAQAVRWLDDWTAKNPLGRGIHHTSGIEMAVRVLTGCYALALLGDAAPRASLGAWLGLLAQQALHCRDHLSLGSSANNHLIAEYAAMTLMGALFPSLREGGRLLEAGLAGLERETLLQIHEDGVPGEQAFGYLPFVWELLLYPFLAAETAGCAVGAAVRERLRASLEFARVIRLPDGRWPQVGDEDDGRVLLAAEGPSRLDLVGNAVAAWLGADGLSARDTALALLAVGRAPPRADAAAERCHQFPDGGYTVWRERGLLVTWDHGPLGLGPLAAHGHADALSITVFRRGDGVVVDPGTFAYHEEPSARDRFRSTPYHGTVSFAGRSQSEMGGPFLWGGRAAMTRRDEGYECTWHTGERHWRRVEVAGERVVIEDRAVGPDAELIFVLHPSARVELARERASVAMGAARGQFEARGIAPWRLENGDYSPRFGHRQPTQRLVAALRGEACRTEIRFGGGPS